MREEEETLDVVASSKRVFVFKQEVEKGNVKLSVFSIRLTDESQMRKLREVA
jgi:hypothetical protein